MPQQNAPANPSYRGWFYDQVNNVLEAYHGTTRILSASASALVLDKAPTLGGRGTVTQATDHTTGVTVNATSGTITLASADLAAGAEAEFTVTNSEVAANDVVVVCVGENNDASGTPAATVSAVAAGSFKITLTNLHASTAAFNDASTLNFAVIKSAA